MNETISENKETKNCLDRLLKYIILVPIGASLLIWFAVGSIKLLGYIYNMMQGYEYTNYLLEFYTSLLVNGSSLIGQILHQNNVEFFSLMLSLYSVLLILAIFTRAVIEIINKAIGKYKISDREN